MKQSAKDKKTHAGSLATVALIVVFIVGMLILLYPTVSTWWNERATTRAVFSYDEAVSALTEADYSSYEVDSIAIVLPSEMDYLFIEEGEDCVTLKNGSISAADGVLTYYEVAALTDGAYVYAEDFSAYTVSRARLSGAELAETLADFTEQNTFTGVSAAVDTEGKVTFDDLELGVYLIVQTEKSTGFDVISPFIVTVPLETDGIWVYDVDAAPKLTVSNSSSTPDDPDDTDEPDLPQTGQLNCPVSALALCGLVSFAGGWKLTFGTRKDQDEDSK